MKNKSIFRKIENVYIISFLVYLVFNSILPYTNIQPSIIRNIISVIFMSGGIFFIGYNIISERKKMIKNYSWILWIFIVVCIISSITMIKYGYMDNAKTIIWSTILFGVLYTYSQMRDNKQMEKTIRIAIIILSIIWSTAILIGLYQYMMQITYFVRLEDYPILKAQGFYYNRLFGIFVDPNFAAVTSVMLLFGSIYSFITSNNKWIKSIWVLNAILQFLYVILSGSRSGLLVFVFGVMIYAFLKVYSSFQIKEKKSNILRLIVTIVISIIAIIVLFLGVKKLLENIPQLINKTNTTQEEIVQDENAQNSNDSQKVSLDRTDLEDKGISNLRFELWGDCLNILKSKPIFGTSPRNLIVYAQDCFQNTYPAKGYDFGNGYLAVLVGTGVLGALVIAVFLCICIKRLFIYIIKKQYNNLEESNFNILAISIIGMMFLAAAINQEIFLVNSINTALFWLMLGYIMKKTENKNINK